MDGCWVVVYVIMHKNRLSYLPLFAVAVADRALIGLIVAEPAVEDTPVPPAVHNHEFLVELPVLEGAGELISIFVGQSACM